MPHGLALELADLPAMHPACGIGLRHAFAVPTVIRLSIDPIPQPSGTTSKLIHVDWVTQSGERSLTTRTLGWGNLPAHVANFNALLLQLPVSVNAQTLTEQGAVGVLALLLHDLENAALQWVLPIGSGGDYLAQVQGSSNQVEVSGIRQAAAPGVSQARLTQKRGQVVPPGYVSVTTFAYPHSAGLITQSFLHFVPQAASRKQKAKSRRKRRK